MSALAQGERNLRGPRVAAVTVTQPSSLARWDRQADRQTDGRTNGETPNRCFMLVAMDATVVITKVSRRETIHLLDDGGSTGRTSMVQPPSECF